jgi:two-component system, chemotaxis family, protein-glutamate methylesterase/glutaminase
MTAAAPSRIRVLIVDDSAACRALLVGIVGADTRLDVVGVVADGEQAIEAAARLLPDVIVMDIHLPGVNGFVATRRIMESCPTRIVMVTATSMPNEVAESFEALESGALTVLAKPPGPGHEQFEILRSELLRTLVLMSEVPVVRRWPAKAMASAPVTRPAIWPHNGAISVVAIGASTGGPMALQALLSALRPEFTVPMVVVQHISLGFADGLAQWLTRSTGRTVRVARHGEPMERGVTYVAPDGLHLHLRAPAQGENGSGSIALVNAAPENGFRPSVAPLFRSAAEQFGRRAAGILLTGMGQDGAKELKLMREAGALTMAQDSASAVINGMPGEAARIGAASHVLSPDNMAMALNRLAP